MSAVGGAAVLACAALAAVLLTLAAVSQSAPAQSPDGWIFMRDGARRGRAPRPAPEARQAALAWLTGPKATAAIWHWLDRLGVPLRDRRDASQDVLERAIRSWATFDPMRSRVERWTNKITVHTAGHYHAARRALKRQGSVPLDDAPEAHEVAAEEPDPGDLLDSARAGGIVLNLVLGLDADARAVVVAHDLDSVPMADIAERRGIPLSTAYKVRARALRSMAQGDGTPERARAICTSLELLHPDDIGDG